MIDTHCHLHDREFFSESQAEEMIRNARNRGIEKMIVVGTSREDSLVACDFAEKHQGIYWAYGEHPSVVSEISGETASKSVSPDVLTTAIAIGEIGLDYHYNPETRPQQIKLFEQQLQLAKDHDLPVIFHVREAFADFFPIVENFPKITGVVHSFSDNKKNLRKILEGTDFYVGVNGLATYSTLPTPSLERTLLETDAPFLAPVPHRGETNQPAYVADVAEWLAHRLNRTITEVDRVTTQNAQQLFGL